jgi:hypothetical protein
MEYPTDTWREWVSDLDVIQNEIIELQRRRMIWQKYFARLQAAPIEVQANAFHDWIVRNYAESASIAVRRLIDGKRNNHSLTSVLERIADRAGEVTFRGFDRIRKGLGGSFDDGDRRAAFKRLTGHDEVLPAEVPRVDRRELLEKLRRLEDWTHQRVAHRARSDVSSVTFEDLHRAHDELELTFRKYSELLTGSTLVSYEIQIADGYERLIAQLFRRPEDDTPR